MTTSKGGTEFEAALKQDLPRGLDKEPRAVGRDRGLHSRWLTADELKAPEWSDTNGIRLGYRNGRTVFWNDDRHLLTIAGSRAGKGVSAIIPNLIFYEGSAVVIDPKGENAARTARRRGLGWGEDRPGLKHDVHVLDPFGESGLPSSAFNPLGSLDVQSPDVIEDIGLFADALITHPEHADRHWSESAQGLLRALILLVLVDIRYADRRHLITVRRLLMLTDPSIEKLQEAQPNYKAKDAEDHDDDDDGENNLTAEQALIRILKDQKYAPFGYIGVGMGEQLDAMSSKERGSILSTARTQTQWLDSPKMLNVLERSDFDLEDIKRKKMTIYLCLPATRMATHSRWLRLIVMMALGVMERVKVKPASPVLFILDEFPVLGYMQSVESAAGLMAGFGVKLWPIIQNLGQLKQHYAKSWETFFANAGVVTAFGISDNETLVTLSQLLGRTNIVTQIEGNVTRQASQGGVSPMHDDRREVPLLAEHELRIAFGRKKNRVLIFNAESNPGAAERIEYYKDPDYAGLFEPDPGHEAKT